VGVIENFLMQECCSFFFSNSGSIQDNSGSRLKLRFKMDRLDDSSLSLIAEFLGEPDTAVAESANNARLRMLMGIGRLAHRFIAWFQFWLDEEMDIAFHP